MISYFFCFKISLHTHTCLPASRVISVLLYYIFLFTQLITFFSTDQELVHTLQPSSSYLPWTFLMTYYEYELELKSHAEKSRIFQKIMKRKHLYFNLLKPNDIYICRTAALTSRRYILNIYSTNIHTEFFKHAA